MTELLDEFQLKAYFSKSNKELKNLVRNAIAREAKQRTGEQDEDADDETAEEMTEEQGAALLKQLWNARRQL
jgi:hypothetical protein